MPIFSFFRTYGRVLRRVPLEAFIWTAGLAAMACADPTAEGLVDVCLFKWLGVTWCPGCGLGHAVAYLFRGEVVQSLAAHPLGIVAVVVLIGHIGRLVRGTVVPQQGPPPIPLFNNAYPQQDVESDSLYARVAGR